VDGDRARGEETVLRLRAESRARLERARALRIARLFALAAVFSAAAVGLERSREVRELERLRTILSLRHETECAEHARRRAVLEEYGSRRLVQAMILDDAKAIAQTTRESEVGLAQAWRAAAHDGCPVPPAFEPRRGKDRQARGTPDAPHGAKWFVVVDERLDD
jgi:hypothetical protein